jgi:hypothetical protein
MNPEQKVGWTWTNPKGRMAGHTTRWIGQRMIDQVEKNRSTTKPDPEATWQRLVAMEINGTTAWWRNTNRTKREMGGR